MFNKLELGRDPFGYLHFYALHDVSKDLRNSIVSEFFRVLKNERKLYIKEPQRENDGMAIAESVHISTI